MKRVLAVGLMLLAVASCAREGRLRVLAPDELPRDLYASPTPSPTAAPVREVRVWFTRAGRLAAVPRTAPAAGGPVTSALQAMLAGPSPEELAAGLATAVPPGAELLDISVSGGTASIDLSREFEESAEQPVFLLRLGQVVYTATETTRASRVRFLIDGEPVSVIGQDGSAHEVVSRADYASLTG